MFDKLYRPVKWERTKDWRLTQEYWANFKVNWKRMYWEIVKERKKHEWLDYDWPVAWQSIPVYSADKWLVEVRNESWFGTYVRVNNKNRCTYYAHLKEAVVTNWDTVEPMQLIWYMGSSGNSTAVHLHFGVRDWGTGKWIDPTPYIVDRPKEEVDHDIQALIDNGIFNWNYEPMDYKRLIKMMWKLYVKLK